MSHRFLKFSAPFKILLTKLCPLALPFGRNVLMIQFDSETISVILSVDTGPRKNGFNELA